MMSDVVEVRLEPLCYGIFGLANILFLTCFASNTIDEVVAFACYIEHGEVFFACGGAN